MIVISKTTIGEAHDSIVRFIYYSCKGVDTITEDNEHTWNLEEPLCVHINNPLRLPIVSSHSLFRERFIDQYKTSMYTITPKKNDGTDATYTYGNRLTDYLIPYIELEEACIGWKGDGNLGGINQLFDSIICRLIKNPNSRRAISITWNPIFDISSKEPPCLQLIQVLIDRRKYLNLVAVFRSNDMLSAWGMNAIALAYLQRFIIFEINKKIDYLLRPGWLETISNSPHIYYKRDAEELSRFIQNRKPFV